MVDGWTLLGLSPQQLGIVAGVSAGLAVLYFLIRPRPPRITVTSHVLWQRVLPRRRNPLIKELILLLMQLIFLCALALAIAEPEREAEVEATAVETGRVVAKAPLDRIWVVDRSLSMSALDAEGRSRLERIRGLLQATLSELPEGVEVGLVGATAAPELLAPLGGDRARLGLSLRMLDISGVDADLPAALSLAASQPGLRPEEALIELFSDDPSAGEAAAAAAEQYGVPVRVRAPFEPGANVSIVAFDLRGTEGLPAEQEALVRVLNRAPWEAEVLLRLETADSVLGEARFRLAPGEQVVRRYRFSPLEPGGVEAVLREVQFPGAPQTGAPPRDALAADDRAYAWIEPVRPVRIWLVTQGNRFLERVLALLPGALAEKMGPRQYKRRRAEAKDVDLVFFDGWAPDGHYPPRAFFINPPGGRGPFASLGRRRQPAVTDWNHDHPMFRGLVLRDLQVNSAMLLKEEAGDVRLLGSPGGALALARLGEHGEKHVGWGFDFAQSDLPLRLAFPQTIVNTVLWMRQGRALGMSPGSRHRLDAPLWLGNDGWREGASVELDPEEGEASPQIGGLIEVTDLMQAAYAAQAEDPLAARRAHSSIAVGDGRRPWRFPRPGLYRLSTGRWSEQIAVNLLDSQESEIFLLPESSSEIVPVPPPREQAPEDGAPPWLWLCLGVGALSLFEFGLYTR